MDPDLLWYLAEDLAPNARAGDAPRDARTLLDGDITSRALSGDARLKASVVAREPCIVAGVAEAVSVFEHLGVEARALLKDGARTAAGTHIMEVEGPAHAVLTGERLALNILMRMSGIATLTRTLQDKVAAINPHCKIAATRKTTPGFRRFEKRAVELGGGDPHRFGLYDAFLVKDNHLLVERDVAKAVARCRALAPDKFLQIEADTPEQAHAAADAGADGVLLDNFTPENAATLYAELKKAHPKLLVEVSGGLTPETVAAYAAGADRLSLGYLTHSARAIDFGLDGAESV